MTRLYIKKKQLIKDLELRYLGIKATFKRFIGGNTTTIETYYSEKYKELVAIFRELEYPIVFKDTSTCWHARLYHGESINNLYTNIDHKP